MQRQKSILSFFRKPSPDKSTSTAGDDGRGVNQFAAKEQEQKPVGSNQPPDLEVRGTDTPPEKVPRQILPANSASLKDSSPFSSIMHKFMKVDDTHKASQSHRYYSSSSPVRLTVIFTYLSGESYINT